jgi:hypothetical protein
MRIGLWFYYVDDKPIQIDQSTLGNIYMPDLCSPIPITPELLEACGFEKDGFNAYNICISPWPETHLKQLSFAGDYLYLREGDLSKNRIHDSLCVLWNNDLRGKMFVHQLQNLYHALTGLELEVTLPTLHKRDIIPFMTHK